MPHTTLRFPIRADRLSMSATVRRTLCDVTSAYQRIEIVETAAFGRALLLDGHIQLTEFDEAAYHEALVHIPLLSVSEPKRALVVGGGDGGVLRELCRYASLQEIDMVDIDAEVVRLCREHLPSVSAGAFDDPRVRLHIADAFEFVKTGSGNYDLIVVDATDVYENEDGALSEQLFTEAFYADCAAQLSADGFIVTQADNLVFCPYSLEAIEEAFARVFEKVGDYWAIIPSFGSFSGYCWASHGATVRPAMPPCAFAGALQYLNPVTYELALGPMPFSVAADLA
ncbi:MAG: hypothetical protein ACK4XJ_09665 [Fimbriimonadaceae bacterium]